MRERAGAWTYRPESTQLVEPDDELPYWRAIFDVAERNRHLFSIGLCFDGTSFWGGGLDEFYRPLHWERSRVEFIQIGGTAEALAQVAADWFERVLAGPIEQRK